MLDEQTVPVETRIKFSRLTAGLLSGAHPWHSEVLERTGTKIVAVERDADVLIELPDDFLLQSSDVVFACGTLASLEAYQREFQAISSPVHKG